MKRPLIYLLFFSVMFSCAKKQVKVANKPDWVIDEKKMVDIITDLSIVNAATYINTNSPPRDRAKDVNFVMKKYQVTDSLFRKSHDYYAEHPEVAEKLYEQVVDKISEMEADNAEGH
jgi:hypothetical protein